MRDNIEENEFSADMGNTASRDSPVWSQWPGRVSSVCANSG